MMGTTPEEAPVLWRVRTTMSDRPGALAALARRCGDSDVNILGLQIFPSVGGVTDELVLRTPGDWEAAQVADLLEGSGEPGAVTIAACTEHALIDGPIDYLHALARLADDPGHLDALLARLLDADPVRSAPTWVPVRADWDFLVVAVGPREVVLRRREPFTPTEHARAVAFAEVAAGLVEGRDAEVPGYDPTSGPVPTASSSSMVRMADAGDTPALVRMHLRCSSESIYRRYDSPLARIDERFARRLLTSGGGALVATVGTDVVGFATVSSGGGGTAELALLVEDAWQRCGVGARLLSAAARLARGQGALEVTLRSRTHNPALMSLAFASGLRARIQMDGESVVVTVGVERLTPLGVLPGPS